MSNNPPAADAVINESLLSALSDPATASLFLAALAERTGAAVFRSAAGMLGGRGVGGRPAHDDRASLGRMAALLKDGSAKSPEQAARFVARTLTTEVSTDAASARLARKYRTGADKTVRISMAAE